LGSLDSSQWDGGVKDNQELKEFYVKQVHGKAKAKVFDYIDPVGVLIASLTIYLFSTVLGMSAAKVFMVLGLMTLVPTIVTICLLPDFLVRFIAVILAKIFYRLKVHGLENIPIEKGALIISNHVSWVDALVLSATLQRRIRFIMDKDIYNNKWLHPLFKLMQIIPISMTDPPKKIVASLKEGRAALDEGYILCIFC